MAEGGTDENTSLIPERDSIGGISSSVPNAGYGSVVISPGCVISPGGNSIGNYIERVSTRRQLRRMTQGRGRRVVHRNDVITASPAIVQEDEDDPIREHRAQPSYTELAQSCNVPGAEIVRVAQPRRPTRMTVDDTRAKLFEKIQGQIYFQQAERIAERENEQRERIRNGEEVDFDESSLLLSDDNVSFGLPFRRPDHVLPASFFQLHFPGERYIRTEPEAGGKANSFVTVLSIWNTMMGASLLSVPWAVGKSGLVAGLLIGVFMAAISGYTAITILDVHKTFDVPADSIAEFAQLCGRLLGPRWEVSAGITSLGAVIGAAIVYWVLMSNFLYNSVAYIQQAASGTLPNVTDSIICPKNNSAPANHRLLWMNDDVAMNIFNATDGYFLNDLHGHSFLNGDGTKDESSAFFDKIWNPTTVPIFLLVIFPVINLRSVTFFTKFNCLGSVSVAFIFAMICNWCHEWGINADFSDASSDRYVPLFKSSFPSLSGMLALGLFIHNAIITICKNNKHQENNKRDVSIAFCCVIFTYLFVGVMFYLSFPLPKRCIEDNLFNNFEITDKAVVIGRILLLFQLFTVFPLIMYILRVQLMILLKLPETMFSIFLVNGAAVFVCILFAIFMPNIGTIIRYSGALCGFLMIFSLPVLVKMKALQLEGNLTWKYIGIYAGIIAVGLANLIAQFCFGWLRAQIFG